MSKLFGSSAAISTIVDPNACPAALRDILIEASALEKIYTFAEIVVTLGEKDYEAYCLLIGSEDGLIKDILIPEQEVTSYSVEISKDALLKISEELEALDSDLYVLGWAHSHHTMTAFSSSTDDDNNITILNQTNNFKHINGKRTKYIYSITVAIKPRDHHGVCASQFECGATLLREANLRILEQENDIIFNKDDLTDLLTEEIEKKITFYKPKPSKWQRLRTWWGKSDGYFSTYSYLSSLKDFAKSQSDSDTEVSWPETLRESNIVETILNNPTIQKQISKLSNELLFDDVEIKIQRKLKKLLKTAITSTFKQIKDSFLQHTKETSAIDDDDDDDDDDVIFYTYFGDE